MNYDAKCALQAPELVRDCFRGEILPNRVNNAIDKRPTKQEPEQSLAIRYDRCELATQLRDKYEIPLDDIGNLLCIAHHASNWTLSEHDDHTFGLFRISNYQWCSTGAKGELNDCNLNCDRLIDTNLDDDIKCLKKIKETEGYGRAWAYLNYNGKCSGKSAEYLEGCFEPEEDKRINRCELARTLRTNHSLSLDEVGEWVCLALHASQISTSYQNRRDYGLFGISADTWCTAGDEEMKANGCKIDCDKLLDEDISDDLACAKLIKAKQGFAAWTYLNFEAKCARQAPELIRDCFSEEERRAEYHPQIDNRLDNTTESGEHSSANNRIKVEAETPKPIVVETQTENDKPIESEPPIQYELCELAMKLRDNYHVPHDDIGALLCLAQHASNLTLSVHDEHTYGLFRITNRRWCSTGLSAQPNLCGIDCDSLLNTDLSDDLKCLEKIKRTAGFDHAWAHLHYHGKCGNHAFELARNCFKDKEGDTINFSL